MKTTLFILGVSVFGFLAAVLPVEAQVTDLSSLNAAMAVSDTLNGGGSAPVATAPSPEQPPSESAPAAPNDSSDGDSQELSSEEGTPFNPSLASAQLANEGIVYLRNRRFEEAKQAFAQAKEKDARYANFHDKVIALCKAAAEGKLDEAQHEKVRPDIDLTWAQFLDWQREPTLPENPMVMMVGPDGRRFLASPAQPGSRGPVMMHK